MKEFTYKVTLTVSDGADVKEGQSMIAHAIGKEYGEIRKGIDVDWITKATVIPLREARLTANKNWEI